MRDVPVIDTLRYAARLRHAGVEPRQAEGMATALNDELATSVLTKADLDERLLPIQRELTEIRTSLESRVDSLESRIDSLDLKIDSRVDGLNMRIDAQDAKFEARFDALGAKMTAMMTMMIFGFTLLTALGFYSALPRAEQVVAPAPAEQEETVAERVHAAP